LLKFLLELNTDAEILFPYIYGWVLLYIL
jgi:hypothetical protein